METTGFLLTGTGEDLCNCLKRPACDLDSTCLWLSLELEEVFGFHAQPVLSLSHFFVTFLAGIVMGGVGDIFDECGIC